VTTRLLDSFYPAEVKRAFRYTEFGHCRIAKFGFSQEFWLIVSHEWKQPVTTPFPLCRRLFPKAPDFGSSTSKLDRKGDEP